MEPALIKHCSPNYGLCAAIKHLRSYCILYHRLTTFCPNHSIWSCIRANMGTFADKVPLIEAFTVIICSGTSDSECKDALSSSLVAGHCHVAHSWFEELTLGTESAFGDPRFRSAEHGIFSNAVVLTRL